MHTHNLVLYEEEFRRVKAIVDELGSKVGAQRVALADRHEQVIATTSGTIATFDNPGKIADAVAACESVRRLVGQPTFSIAIVSPSGRTMALGLVSDRVVLLVESPTCGERELLEAMSTALQSLTGVFDEIVRKTKRDPDYEPDEPGGVVPPRGGDDHGSGGAAAVSPRDKG